MNQGFGIWTQKKFRVVLELTDWAAAFVKERTWSPKQKIVQLKDKTRLSFWATSEPEVIALVLSFGNNAKLIKPESLQVKLREELDQMNTLYNPNAT